MAPSIRIAAWNANGLPNHVQEITAFLKVNKLDVLLISESHSTERTVVKIPLYTTYLTHHPDGTAHAGTAIIIKSSIKHYFLQNYATPKIQGTILKIETFTWPLAIAAIYCPPRHSISIEEYETFFQELGPRFIAAGDWNAKHTVWGSRLITPKGRNLLACSQRNNLNFLSTGQPTYWPTDQNRIPDLLDFAVIKGISNIHYKIEPSLDLSSDHTAIIITLSTTVIWKEPVAKLCNKRTNWEQFQAIINTNINLKHRIKEPHEIEKAVQHLTEVIQDAAWKSTPDDKKITTHDHNIPLQIKEILNEKRRARAKWQRSRNPRDKTQLNRLTHQLRTALIQARNETFKYYISNLTPNDHSLWQATKKFKRPITSIPPIRKSDLSWAKTDEEKSNTLAQHLAQVFSLHTEVNAEDEEVYTFLDAPCQLSLPLKPCTPTEIWKAINKINPHKAPGYDLINGDVLKHLPRKAIVLLTIVYNSMIRLCHFPIQWKYAQIIMIAKPGKPPTEPSSYRPISLLPIMSKIFERLLLVRILERININNIIPDHQFGFRQNYSTIQQCHRIVNYIKETLEGKKMCAAVFLDVEKAFDKVWHKGLLYKVKKNMPNEIYLILKSYLNERFFQIKVNTSLSKYHPIQSGVPQGSVLGPFLYLLYTADIPADDDITMATFADDTGILTSDDNPDRASNKLQNYLSSLQTWLTKWKIKVNGEKSSQITFTTRRIDCPQVHINNIPIPLKSDVKYLGLHLDRKLTWKNHIKTKKAQLNLKVRQMYWLLGKRSQLSLENKVLLYKIILKPIWSYGIELWGCSKPSNTKILQTFQSKTLRMIANAPWYVSNITIHNDLGIPFIEDVIRLQATKAQERNFAHESQTIQQLYQPPLVGRRLKRTWPEDLTD